MQNIYKANGDLSVWRGPSCDFDTYEAFIPFLDSNGNACNYSTVLQLLHQSPTVTVALSAAPSMETAEPSSAPSMGTAEPSSSRYDGIRDGRCAR